MKKSLPPERDLTLPQNLQALALRNFLYGLRMNMVRAIWQPYVLSLGASMPLLGLLESVGGFGGIVSTTMLPIGGWLSDRLGRKPFVLISSAVGFVAMATFAIAGWLREWRLLLPGVVLLGITAVARPAMDSMTAESVTAAKRGHAFGVVAMYFAISGALAPTVGGFLASRYGFLLVLALGALLEAVTIGLAALTLQETLPPSARPTMVASQLLTLLKQTVTPPARLRSFYVAVTVDVFAFGAGSAILPGMLTSTYHFTPFQLGVMVSVSSATWALSQLFFARQVDKRGCVPILILSEGLGVVLTTGWLLARSFHAFVALEVVGGLLPATWAPAFMAWINNSVPEGQRAEELGRLGAFRGLIGFPAPFLGGLLYSRFGFRGPVLVNLIGVAMVVVLLWRFVGEPQLA